MLHILVKILCLLFFLFSNCEGVEKEELKVSYVQLAYLLFLFSIFLANAYNAYIVLGIIDTTTLDSRYTFLLAKIEKILGRITTVVRLYAQYVYTHPSYRLDLQELRKTLEEFKELCALIAEENGLENYPCPSKNILEHEKDFSPVRHDDDDDDDDESNFQFYSVLLFFSINFLLYCYFPK
jgi:hypothetical protein